MWPSPETQLGYCNKYLATYNIKNIDHLIYCNCLFLEKGKLSPTERKGLVQDPTGEGRARPLASKQRAFVHSLPTSSRHTRSVQGGGVLCPPPPLRPSPPSRWKFRAEEGPFWM